MKVFYSRKTGVAVDFQYIVVYFVHNVLTMVMVPIFPSIMASDKCKFFYLELA